MTSQALASRNATDVGFIDRMPGIVLPQNPPTRVRKLVIWLFIMGFGLFGGLGTWAAMAPMRSAVLAPGVFKVDGDRLVVQHYEGGIVRKIYVKEGSLVNEGDPIAELDQTRSRAQMGILYSQLVNALSQNMRLQAEFSGADTLEPSAEIAALIAIDPNLNELFVAQKEVFLSNLDLEFGQIAILQDRLAQQEEQLVGVQSRLDALNEQRKLVEDERRDLDKLYSQGLITKARYTGRRQDEVAIIGDIGTAQSQYQDILQRIAEAKERILQVRRDRLIAIAAERQQVQERIFDIRQRIDATVEVKDRLIIRSPKKGRVVGLEINTLGEVLEAGQKVLEILPEDTRFIIESRVRPNDIDEVVPGGPARVRLSAFSFRTTPTVEGRVIHVAADSQIDDVTGEAYYRVDIEVSPGELDRLNGAEVLAGMSAQVMLTTGEQTLVDYLLSPVIGGLETAMIEKQ